MDNTADRNVRPQLDVSAKHFVAVSKFPEPARALVERVYGFARTTLAEDYTGVTADGTPEKGHFPIFRTGVSTQPIVDAANAFRATLRAEQWKRVTFDVDDVEAWRSWHNMHFYLMRHGLMLGDLDPAPRAAALKLLEVCSSAAGNDLARDIMKLNEHAAEITDNPEEFGEWYYWISIFGEPSLTEPWGWQIDGHHLIVNCFVLGDQMVMTPDFRGSEPVHAKFGKYAGTHVLQEEQTRGLALMHALTADQQKTATIGTQIPRDVLTTAQHDNEKLAYAGLRGDAMTPQQQELLLSVAETYVGRIRPGHAEVRMEDVKKHLAETWFGWIGTLGENEPFYYRIHSPVILIEFDHIPGVIFDNAEPSRDHIHTVVRTPNGNDYGRDLLRQHYEQHDHSHPHTHHRRGLS